MTDQITARIAAAFQAGDMTRVVALAQALPEQARATHEIVLLAQGLAQHALQQHGEAAATLRHLVQLKPGVPEYWNNLAIAAREAGEFDEAESASLRALALAPDNAQFHHNLGLLYAQLRRWPEARRSQFEAVRLAPGFVEARLQAALVCHVCGDLSGEDSVLDGVARWPAQPVEQALTLANILSARGEQAAAFDVLAKAVPPPDAFTMRIMAWRVAAMRAALHERSNRIAQAEAELATLPLDEIAALPDAQRQARHDIAHVRATLRARAGDYAGAAALWQDMLDTATASDQRTAAAFGLAAALDKCKRYDEALQAARLAHAEQMQSMRHIVPHLLDENAQSWPILEQRVSQRERDAWSTLPAPRGEQNPVFVVGFPRSGTTLLEQMIDAHTDFRSMDERPFIYDLIERMRHAGQPYPEGLADLTAEQAQRLRQRYAEMVADVLPDLGAARLVDKNPLNMFSLPMIMRLYPEARIILCLRHPCDALLSCYLLPFRSPAFATMCSTLPRLARGYVQMFEQWYAHVEVFAPRVLEWRYESVVECFDEHVERLGRFLDIENTAPMKRFDEHARNKGYISTPSYAQVTQGINRKAVNRWHAYRAAFEPALPILRPLLERLGYEA